MMMKKKEEMQKRRRKKKDCDLINDSDELIEGMIKKMKVAAEVSVESVLSSLLIKNVQYCEIIYFPVHILCSFF